MFQTIIIGIDGRPQDAEALALAQQLADPGAEFIAAKVSVIDQALFRSSGVSFEAEMLETADDIVDAFTESSSGIEGVVTSAASVGLGLRDLALGASADLIVVASSRRGLAGRVFAGDSVRDVLRHATCPVAVAVVGHTSTTRLATITAGYDGSDESEAALSEATRLAARDAADLTVLEVVEPTIAVAAMSGAYVGAAVDDEYRRARENMDAVAQRYGVKGVIATGSAARELVAASRGADLLTIGLRNHDLLDRVLVGSTGHALLREQAAPMLIVPPAGTPGEHDPVDALDELGAA